MKEHQCHVCGGLVPVLGGEFRPQGRRTVFVCVDCCSDDPAEYREDIPEPTKRRKSAKPRGGNDC